MRRNTKSNFKLLTSTQYIKDLTDSVTKAKSRVAIMCLTLTDDPTTHKLVLALKAAAKRGVDVNIAVDVFTYNELGGYFSPFKRFSQDSRKATTMANQLKRAGITFTWLGRRHKINPFRGLTHIKWSIVDTTTYSFGGVNLYKEGIDSTDFMLRSPDPLLAEQLYEQHLAVVSSHHLQYPGFMAKTPYGTIYVDSGRPRDSIIYNRILELAATAKHSIVVTQYCPTGELAALLKLGDSDIYFNQPKNTYPATRLLIWFAQVRTGLRTLYRHKKYVHAKFIIFTMPSGEKIAITGSHNFAHSGVLFGTREVALETSDPSILKQLETFLNTHVK